MKVQGGLNPGLLREQVPAEGIPGHEDVMLLDIPLPRGRLTAREGDADEPVRRVFRPAEELIYARRQGHAVAPAPETSVQADAHGCAVILPPERNGPDGRYNAVSREAQALQWPRGQ